MNIKIKTFDGKEFEIPSHNMYEVILTPKYKVSYEDKKTGMFLYKDFNRFEDAKEFAFKHFSYVTDVHGNILWKR